MGFVDPIICAINTRLVGVIKKKYILLQNKMYVIITRDVIKCTRHVGDKSTFETKENK